MTATSAGRRPSNSLEQARLAALAALLVLEGEVVQPARGRLVVVLASSEIGWPAAHESAAAAYGILAERDALLGRDPGDLQQVALGGRLGRHAGRLAGGLGERGVDVGRVVQLDELRGRLDDLGLADPLAGDVVEVAAPAAEVQVGRDRQVVGLVVDQGHPAEDGDPVLVVVEEAAQLLGRTGR